MSQSGPERSFLFYWCALAPTTCAEPVTEYRFARPRRWRFDFAWPDLRIAVEIEGGVYTRGRHVRPGGYQGDIEKYNAAVLAGWRVLRYTAPMLDADPARVVREVATLVMNVKVA